MALLATTTDNCSNISSENPAPGFQIISKINIGVLFVTFTNIVIHSSALFSLTIRQSKTSCKFLMRIMFTLSLVEILFQTLVFSFTIVEYHQFDTLLLEKGFLGFIFVDIGIRVMVVAIVALLMIRNWVITFLAIHRFEAICKTYGSKKLVTIETWPKITVVVALSSLLLSTPRFFEYHIKYCAKTGQDIYERPLLTQFFFYRIFYIHIFLFQYQTAGPTAIVIILSTLMLLRIRKRTKFYLSCSLKMSRRTKSSTDKLIVGICVVFFVLEMPTFISKIVTLSQYSPNAFVNVLSQLANLCVYLDSFANFFLYFLSNKIYQIRVAKNNNQPVSQSTNIMTKFEPMLTGWRKESLQRHKVMKRRI